MFNKINKHYNKQIYINTFIDMLSTFNLVCFEFCMFAKLTTVQNVGPKENPAQKTLFSETVSLEQPLKHLAQGHAGDWDLSTLATVSVSVLLDQPSALH